MVFTLKCFMLLRTHFYHSQSFGILKRLKSIRLSKATRSWSCFLVFVCMDEECNYGLFLLNRVCLLSQRGSTCFGIGFTPCCSIYFYHLNSLPLFVHVSRCWLLIKVFVMFSVALQSFFQCSINLSCFCKSRIFWNFLDICRLRSGV